MNRDVELVVNCYQRTYQQVLRPGFLDTIAQQNRFQFACRTVLLNNIDDLDDATSLAEKLASTGEVDRVIPVAPSLDSALGQTGLDRRALGRVPFYSDFALVAITQARCPWLLVWDAEISLKSPASWIEPALDVLTTDPRVLVANPSWALAGLERETVEESERFALGYGFSDQVFLARTEELASPIYNQSCLASWRYPTAHIAATFEQRLDSYMRRNRRLRATFLDATYRHPHRGTAAYRPRGVRERLLRARNRLMVRALERSRSSDPCRRIYWR